MRSALVSDDYIQNLLMIYSEYHRLGVTKIIYVCGFIYVVYKLYILSPKPYARKHTHKKSVCEEWLSHCMMRHKLGLKMQV